MPILSSAAPVLAGLAASLESELFAGRPARASVGAKDSAFAWTTGLPSVVARHVSSVFVEGSGYDAVIVSPSGSPAAVAESAAKPTLAQLETKPVVVKKYAGLASFSTERAVRSDALAAAVSHVLVQQALIAYDRDVIAALKADADAAGDGGTWGEAILAGIADVIANGGQPSLLVLSGADYAAAVAAPGAGYLLDPREGVPTLFGMRVAISAGAAAGESFVLDPTAVTCGEYQEGPFVVVDPYSGLSTNEIRVAAEMFASVVVNGPGAVAALTVTPA